MAFQLSPAVEVNEIDLTLGVPAVATSIGAYAGAFQWGPVDEIRTVSSENDLAARFGKPNDEVAEHFYSAANFLAYGNNLKLVRVVGALAKNASTGGVPDGALVKNEDDYERQIGTLAFDFISRYPGTLGNGIEVHACDEDGYDNWIYKDAFDGKPSASGNEIHIAVVDGGGDWTGTPGTILERYQYVSTVEGTQSSDGTNIYFKEQLNRTSKYVWVGDNAATSIASALSNVTENVAIDFAGLTSEAGIAVTAAATEVSLSTLTLEDDQTSKRYLVWFQDTGTTDITNLNYGTDYTIDTVSNKILLTAAAFGATGQFPANGTVGVYEYQFDASLITESFDDDDVLTVTWKQNNCANNQVGGAAQTIIKDVNCILHPDATTAVSIDATPLVEGVDFTITYYDHDGATIGNFITLVNPLSGGEAIAITTSYPDKVLVEDVDYVRESTSNKITLTTDAFDASAGEIAWNTDGIFPDEGTLEVIVGGQYAGTLAAGVDDNVGVDVIDGFQLFQDAEVVDISLVITGPATITQAKWVIDNICETRKDCVAFVSPTKDDVVNNPGDELIDTIDFFSTFNSSSYAVADSGWKYQYDQYNDLFRWVPLNGDIAGLTARTDETTDPWFSPAGYNRGLIKNVVKLSWSPNKTQRDELFKNRVNPVITEKGSGTLLIGDKTMLSRPSAFDAINVRRLFIVLEKAIATAAKFLLFEFNDEFTRAQFINFVEPYLRDVQGRRGIFDFKVVADETNNTGEVIDRNEFIGDIYIKPARAIRYITLNFIAVRTDVTFEEVGG